MLRHFGRHSVATGGDMGLFCDLEMLGASPLGDHGDVRFGWSGSNPVM